MRILITICARGGSKGLPGKNVKLLNGKHLIGYTIEFANKIFKSFDPKIELSTDDNEIIAVAKKYGLCSNYIRPKNLASDNSGKLETIRHLLDYSEKIEKINYDFIIDLDVTSPLRTIKDIENAFKILNETKRATNIFSVNSANKNPYFNMIEINNEGFAELVKFKSDKYLTRQSSPKVYELNAAFYIYKRIFFDSKKLNLINKNSIAFEMDHISFDIDNLIDFDFMNYLLESNKLKNII